MRSGEPIPYPKVPAPVFWAQRVGASMTILLFASLILSWALALQASGNPCPPGEVCFRWAGLWMAPSIAVLHSALGLLALGGTLALQRRQPWSGWLFAVPVLYLIVYGAAWTIVGIFYWRWGLGWFVLASLVAGLALAQASFLLHPATRRWLRPLDAVDATAAAT